MGSTGAFETIEIVGSVSGITHNSERVISVRPIGGSRNSQKSELRMHISRSREIQPNVKAPRIQVNLQGCSMVFTPARVDA